MHRLFFAVWPDSGGRERLAELARRLSPTYPARWVRPTRYHLTLAFLGNHAQFPDSLIARAVEAAGTVRSAPFTWRPDVVRGFGGSHPACVLGAMQACAPMLALRRNLLAALGGADAADAHPCVPHVTLGYGRGHAIAEQRLAPHDFPVRAFVLLHSATGQSAYRELGRWPLVGPEGAFSDSAVYSPR